MPWKKWDAAAAVVALALSLVTASSGRAAEIVAPQSLPFRLQDNLVRLPALVDGKWLNGVLDSGTGAVIIDLSAAKQLGIKPGTSIGAALGGGTGPQAVFAAPVKSFSVGDYRSETISGVAMSLSPLSKSAGFPIDILLGEPVFAHQIVQVDYRRRRVYFAPAHQEAACTEPVPMTLTHGVPVIEAELQATASSPPRKLRLIVDLGTRHFAALIGGRFLDSAEGRQLQQRALPEQIGTGSGGAISGSIVRIASLLVGRQGQADIQVALTRQVKAFEMGGVDGTLGVPFWEKGSITFDYAHGRLCLAP